MRAPIPYLVAGILVLGGCARTGCSDDAPRGPTLLTSPGDSAFRATAPDTFIARFETSRGNFFVQVVREWAPRGADRFYNLVRNGFYDGNRFFRVVDSFVVQWGVSGDPDVSHAWARQCIRDDPVRSTNTRRAVTFAFGRPHTRTTQVFINYALNARLNQAGFAPFGQVIEGMEVVDSLYAGYGDGPPRGNGPDAVRVVDEGNAYLDREFPRLDSIIRARVVAQDAAH
ncbi:MAG TPA: peptidylprolyl isomerase [Longimicrobiales bacterium]|nr:peptidylprolyl isomerase [Longimicrobiales bacterium]